MFIIGFRFGVTKFQICCAVVLTFFLRASKIRKAKERGLISSAKQEDIRHVIKSGQIAFGEQDTTVTKKNKTLKW